MKSVKLRAVGTLLASLLFSQILVSAAESIKYGAEPRGSSVKIVGTSTLHDWEMEGQLIGGTFVVAPEVQFGQGKLAGVKEGKLGAEANVIIPVRALKSGKSSMDEVMQDAMNEKQHPRIVYKLTELKVVEGDKSPYQFNASGDLTINGVTKKVSFPVTITPTGDSQLKISGQTKLKMSDFKVEPPRPKIALGLIRTGDDITINFDWLVKKRG